MKTAEPRKGISESRGRGKAYLGRRIAAAELNVMKQGRGALSAEGEGNADNYLIEPEPDAKQHHRDCKKRAGDGATKQPEPQGVAGPRKVKASIGAEEHHALETDVQYPGLFRDLFPEAREQQGNCGSHGPCQE